MDWIDSRFQRLRLNQTTMAMRLQHLSSQVQKLSGSERLSRLGQIVRVFPYFQEDIANLLQVHQTQMTCFMTLGMCHILLITESIMILMSCLVDGISLRNMYTTQLPNVLSNGSDEVASVHLLMECTSPRSYSSRGWLGFAA